MDVNLFVSQTLNGVGNGVVYASIALALVLIFKTTGLLNFAQGEMALFSTYIVWKFTTWGWPVWIAILLAMAISFVGASAIWTLVYAYDDPSESATGALNAVWRLLGGEPQTWLQISSGRLNSMLLMVILVWLQVGFAMILLSSAIKGVPEDTLEAARIDGASEFQIFARVVIPQIKGTIITVFITVVILVLKVFDIVYVLTNGRDKTNVIANLFFNELINNEQAGRASAIVVVLLIAVTPVLIYQVRHFRAEEAGR